MAKTTRIGGYEAMVISVGYIFADEVEEEMWQAAVDHEIDGSRLIHVSNAIEALEDSDEPLSDAEHRLLKLCKQAEDQGLEDIVLNRG